MTVKGKRAKAIRKLTEEDVQRLRAVPDFDTRAEVPREQFLDAIAPIADVVNVSAFEDFVSREVGTHWASVARQHIRPSRAEEITWITETVELTEQLQRRLSSMPPRVWDFVLDDDVASHFVTGNALKFHHQMWMYRAILSRIEDRVKGQHNQAGAPPRDERDHLLYILAHWLQETSIAKEVAAGVAAAVLGIFGIQAPDDPRKARSIVRKIEGQIKQTS